MVVLGKREVHGNRLRTGAYLQLDAMVLQQQVELVQVVVVVQVRAGQRGLEAAGAGDKTVAQARGIGIRLAADRIGVDAHQRVAGPHMAGDVVTGDTVADVHVERLRAKIDWWHIRTVRDVGSCFRA